ncbi:peptidoglycan-associated lipoprotein Pal [Curvibacter sp. APW13]|uniref:peptidoglycan-associated lipoprotein Pal n=1 Tax=Curvibacter sp. APW13 TaxID=3077236 RepID=UPI0039658688
MVRYVGLLAVSLVLAACGSSVKLDTPPVEDRSGTAVGKDGAQGNQSGANSNAVASGSVTKVELGNASQDAFLKSATRLVYFDYDSYTVRAEFQPVIEAHAKFLKANPTRKIALEGHTDERGGREYNLALGQRRAEAVRRALGVLGVSDSQMEAVSFGKEKPADMGSTEEAMAKNRRVEINYR